jgi:hypothetical protein
MERNNKAQGKKNNKRETKRIQRINEINSWFFDNINNIDKPSVKLTKRKREQTQINRDEKRDITINTKETQRIIREYFKNLYSKRKNKKIKTKRSSKKKKTLYSSSLENLQEMDEYDLRNTRSYSSRFEPEDISKLNRSTKAMKLKQ